MLTAFDKHNRLMAEAQDGHGTQFTRRSIVLIHHLLSQTNNNNNNNDRLTAFDPGQPG